MHLTSVDAGAVDLLASGVQRSWVATEELGSTAVQVSVLTLPPTTTYAFEASGRERICVLVKGDAELWNGSGANAIETGTIIHSVGGAAFTLRSGAPTRLLVVSGGLQRPSAKGAWSLETDGPRLPAEFFSLYDVKDEVLHQPAAGFFNMATRMLLNASQGGYRSLILGQSSFASETGVHVLHRHAGADELFYLWDGNGAHLAGDGTEHPMQAGDAVFVPRNEWHGFRNTGDRPVRAFFCLMGTGVMQRAGNEILDNGIHVNAFAAPAAQQAGPPWMIEAGTDE